MKLNSNFQNLSESYLFAEVGRRDIFGFKICYIANYTDNEKYADDLFMEDYHYDDGHVFRAWG